MHQAVITLAATSTQVEGHLLDRGGIGRRWQISRRGGDHQIATVVEHHRHTHCSIHHSPRRIAHGKSEAGKRQQHRETGDSHEAKAHPPTQQERHQRHQQQGRPSDPQPFTGCEQKRISAHGLLAMERTLILRPPKPPRATGPPSRRPRRALGRALPLTTGALAACLAGGLLGWQALDRGGALLYPRLRPWLERQVGRTMGHPLQLGPYSGLRPWGLAVGSSRFLPGRDNPSTIEVGAVTVSFDPVRSLLQQAWVLQIRIHDARVHLRRNSRGAYWELGRQPPGRPMPRLGLRIALEGPVRVALQAPGARQPQRLTVEGDAEIRLHRRELELSGRIHPAEGGTIALALRSRWQRNQWQLQLTPRALPLQTLLPLLPNAVQQQLNGRLQGQLQGRVLLHQGQRCEGKVLVRDLRWRSALLPAPLQAEPLRLRCQQRQLWLDPTELTMGSWRGQLAGGLSLAMPAADQLRLTLQASDRQRGHRLSARLQGPWRQPQLALQGQLQALRLPGSPARPVVVRADLALGLDPKPNVRLTQLQLRRGDASLEASGKLWPRLDVRSRRVTLGQELAAPLASLLGPEDSRRIQLQLLGPWQQPQINVQVQQHATSLLGPLELALRWRPGLLRLERLTTPELSASGELPLQPNRSGGLRPGNLLLSLDLRRFPLERLNALLGTRLQGDLQAWGEIRGPLTALQPDLELVVRNPGVGPLRLEETWQGHLHAAAGGGGLTLQALAPAAPGRLVARLDRRWLPLTLDLERGTGVLSLRGSPRHYSWNARRFPLQGLALAMTIGAAPQPVQGTLNGQGHLALQPLRMEGAATLLQPQLLGLSGRQLQLSGWWQSRRFALNGRWQAARGSSVALRLRGSQGGPLWSRIEARQLSPLLAQQLQLAWLRARSEPLPPGGLARDLGALAIPAANATLNDQLAALLAAQRQHRAAGNAATNGQIRSSSDLDGRLDVDLNLAGPRADRLTLDLDVRGRLWWREAGLDRPLDDAPITVRVQGPLWLGRGSFNLQNLPLALLALLTPVPEGLRGGLNVQGSYSLGGRRSQPRVAAQLSLTNGALRDQSLALERGELALRQGILTLDLSLRGAAASNSIDLRGRIPLRPEQTGLELRLASRGDGLRFLSVLGGPGLRWQQGSADLQLLVRGSQVDPVANGFLRLRQGVLQLAGQTMRDVEATVLFDFSELELQQLNARVGRSGRLRGSGQLPLFASANEVPRLLRLQLEQVPFTLPRMSAQGDGELLVSGSLRRPVLGGEVRLSRGSINVQPGQLASEAVPERPVTVRELLEERWDFSRPLVVMGQQLESTASRDLRDTVPNLPFLALSDLRLRLGPDLRVTVPNVLNFNTGGLLTLNGPLDPSIRASGVVRLLKGRLGLFTTNFSLDPDAANVAVFTPSLGLIPYLDIALRTRVSDTLSGSTASAGPDLASPYNWNGNTAFSSVDQLRLVKVRLEATGPVDRLAQNIRLTSSPPLPTERLVALIGGNSLVGLVAGNAGSALATVLGQSLLSPLVGGLSDAFGQRLSFALYPTYFAPAEVQASANRSRRLPSQLVLGSEIGLDLTERFNFSVLAAPNRSDIPSQMTLRYQASDRLGVQTSIDTEGRWQSQLQLFFRF